MKRYYSLLDLTRFFAAFWVMNFHYFFGNAENTQLHWYRYGNLGVQIFFVISGFVIVQSLKGKSLGEFAKGRFVRLFPLFWVLCTLTYILTIFLPDVRSSLHFSDYVRSMTMIGDVFNGIIGPAALIDPSYWTLTVELIFYVGIAMFVRLFTHGNIRYFLLVWLVISMAAFWLHIDENFYVKLALVRHASYFIFGASLALLAGGEARTTIQRALDGALLFSSALFVKLSMIVGGLTYPLYLLHQRIGNMLIDLTIGISPVSWFTLVICFEIIIIGTAYFLYLLDKRFRTYVQSFTH